MSSHAWILEVLSDMRDYAEKNNLPKLQEMVQDAEFVAMREIEVALDTLRSKDMTIAKFSDYQRSTGDLLS